MGQNLRVTASDNPGISVVSRSDVLADPNTPNNKSSQQVTKSHTIPHRPTSLPASSLTTAMTTSPTPTRYFSALSLASSPSPSSYRAPPPPQPSSKPTPSYKSLLKSHRRLESTIAALQSQLSEEKRSAAWWKNRVCELDSRCRSIDVDLARVTKEKHTLDRIVAKLQMRQRIVPRMIDAATQTDEEEDGNATEKNEGEIQKDLVIKALIQMVWNKQAESALLSSGAPAGCECDAAKALRDLFPKPPSAGVATTAGSSARAPEGEAMDEGMEEDDPLKRILRRRGKRLSKARATGALEWRDNGRVPHVEAPPHPHPEVFSKARRERKEALKMRLRAAREMVDGLQKENGVLEELLREGSEVGSNRAGEKYGDRFGYD
ncbi:hypothetical protein L873DRAFT_1798787 [Choiromyces venosus 120613-1]|uniref:Uncharacterized protein n=1 Tax=Choiromyces venosus 120613-1 TaxID=1336337 RepID=A0A3N4K5Y6_9PEZI|nr:hypothetical protein L873DRAFT_1798787 [Choiromyces venosus 120613-1]